MVPCPRFVPLLVVISAMAIAMKLDGDAPQKEGDAARSIPAHHLTMIEEFHSYQRLWSWAKENGAQGLENIRVKYFEKEGRKVRGLAVNKDVKAGSFVMHIPQSILLHDDHPLVQASPANRSSYGVLMMYIAIEKCKVDSGKPSFWSPWFAVMPSKENIESFHPMFSSDQLLESFRTLPITEAIRGDKKSLQDLWEKHGNEWTLLAREAGASEFGFDDFRWSFLIMATRQYTADWNRAAKVMVPISDLANTGFQRTVEWSKQLDDQQEWSLWVENDLNDGDELLQSYQIGNHGTAFLLRHYGFYLPLHHSEDATVMRQKFLCTPLKLMLDVDPATSNQPVIFANLQSLAREQCSHIDDDHEEL